MFDTEKGFGFIAPDEGGDDVFVHRQVCGPQGDRTAYLDKGDRVTYDTQWDDRKNKYSAKTCTGFKTGGGGGGGGRGRSRSPPRGGLGGPIGSPGYPPHPGGC